MFNNNEWLAQVREEVIDPDREIIDPHHHLWPKPHLSYDLEELWSDTEDGHNVTQTVFMECGSAYRTVGPDRLKPIGETEFVAAAAARSAADPGKATIAGIIGHADLRGASLDEVLDAHVAAGSGLFRGIRHAGSFDPHKDIFSIPGRAPEGLYRDTDFRRGVARLGQRNFTYDTWNYHHQILDFADLARAVPETTMVLDHFGTPIGVGPYAGKREEIFAQWKDDIAVVAENRNVFAKLGGLAMPDNGFGWNTRATPPTSDEFVAAQARYYHHAIKCFGPERCMFESNFPVDRLSISYHVLWNGLKKIAADYSDADQTAMFSGTARMVYRLGA
ncbi:amidohydrolase family protein [Hyphomonas sp.]|uniref:amidohydrolase family protein n=1 Tax=Hyphomonas sp. TaxID=87 RepID=UPI0032F01F5C